MLKRIPGFEEYSINEEGIVISHKYLRHKPLKWVYDSNGYPQVTLFKDKKRHIVQIHRLVWRTFVGEIPKGMCVLHGKGNDKNNPSLNYLSLGTYSQNGLDRVRDGTDQRGSKHHHTKLTEVQVRWIKQRLNDGMQAKSLAKFFNVNRQTIGDIKSGRNWGYLQA